MLPTTLLVAYDPDLLELLDFYLRTRLGYSVVGFTEPVPTLGWAQSYRPDVLVSDVDLPAMDDERPSGRLCLGQLPRRLRELYPSLAVILMGVGKPLRAEAGALEARALEKPVSLRELFRLLSENGVAPPRNPYQQGTRGEG